MLLAALSHEINAPLGAGVTIPGPIFPVAAFSFVDNLGNENAVDFADESTGGAIRWLWEFGDGTYSYAQHPTHVYAAPGTYQTKLTATNAGGLSLSIIHEVTVPTIASLSARIVAYAGKTLVLPPGSHELDASVTPSTARIVLQHGAVITVPADRELNAELDFSQGGKIQPATGVIVTLTGKINCPPLHHAFDLSAGGSFSITRRIPFLSPDMFGAAGDDTTDDDLPLSAAFGVALQQNGGHVFCPNRYSYVATAPFLICEGTYLAGLGRNNSGLRNRSTTGANMFNPIGGAFERGWQVQGINLICEAQAGHIVEPDTDAGISDGGWSHVDAKVLNPLKSIWAQSITQRGTFFFSFTDCRLECGSQSVRSQVPAIDIDGVDNSFSAVWFFHCRLQCNHSKAPFFRATNSAGGNPLKQLVFRDCAGEQMQSGYWQVQGTIGFTLDTFTLFDTVTPVRGPALDLQTGTGGLGNEGASIRNWLRTAAELGQAAGPLLEVASVTRSSTTATITTVADHGWVTGDEAELNGCTPSGYEGDQPITVTGARTATYPCGGSLATPATPSAGGITARRVGRAVASMTQAAGVATCNLQQAHDGIEEGQRIFVKGAAQSEYNGLKTVTAVLDADSVQFSVDSGATSPATGTITAGLAALDIQMGPDDVRAYLENVVGGSEDANVDVNDTSAIIVGKSTAVVLSRVPEATSTVLGLGSGASVETANVLTSALTEREAGGGISILESDPLLRFLKMNVGVDLPSISNTDGSDGLWQVVTVPGVKAGDVVLISPPSTGPGGTTNMLIVGGGWASADNEVTFCVYNSASSAIDATNKSYRFLVFGF